MYSVPLSHLFVTGLMGKPIGQHPLVIRLLKGISNERPPRPRYTTTWDVSKVTSYLSSLGDNKTLSLKQLSKKLVMLLALISPEQSSVLADLDTRYLKKHPDGFTFLTNPRKTGDPTSESSVSFPSLPEDLSLCPLACLNTYLTATRNFRSPGHQKLFLSFHQPHNEISRSTIARWLCDVIQSAGIDSSVFKARSTKQPQHPPLLKTIYLSLIFLKWETGLPHPLSRSFIITNLLLIVVLQEQF